MSYVYIHARNDDEAQVARQLTEYRIHIGEVTICLSIEQAEQLHYELEKARGVTRHAAPDEQDGGSSVT